MISVDKLTFRYQPTSTPIFEDFSWEVAQGEAWAPVLLEMAGVPTLGSDALTLSLSLDKLWTRQVVAAAGVPVIGTRTGGTPELLTVPDGR